MFDLLELFEGDERDESRRERKAKPRPRGRVRGWISRIGAPFEEDDDGGDRARHRKRRERDFGWD